MKTSSLEPSIPIRTLVVGCGAVAQRLYRRPLQQLTRQRLLRVEALVDPAANHAATLGRFFPDAARYADLETALARCMPDLSLVLSPAHLHCDQTILALTHGSHVLCEKPMAFSEAECIRMNAAAETAKRILGIGMIRRFFPAYAQFREILQGGRLGTAVSFEYREGHRFDWDVTTAAAFRPRSAGGTGVLFDIGPHAIDHLTWTLGDVSVEDYCDDALDGVEANAILSAAIAAGRGTVHLSWNHPQTNELRVQGTRGEAVLRIGCFDQCAVRIDAGFEPQPITAAFAADLHPVAKRRITPRTYGEAMHCQIVQMLRAIVLGEPPAVDGAAGRRCVATLERALQIARPMDTPWLDLAQQTAFRRLHWTHSV